MKIELPDGKIIDFTEISILNDDNELLYKAQHFNDNDYFQIVKFGNDCVFENIDDMFMLKSCNVINVK